MTEPQRDITYILHWGDLTATVRMLAAAKTIRDAYRRDRIILLTTPDYESFLKHCPWFNAIEIDACPDTRPMAGLRDKRPGSSISSAVRTAARSRAFSASPGPNGMRWRRAVATPSTRSTPSPVSSTAFSARVRASFRLAVLRRPMPAGSITWPSSLACWTRNISVSTVRSRCSRRPVTA